MNKNSLQISKLTLTVFFVILTISVGLIEIPFPPGFLKIDFSEVVILASIIFLNPYISFYIIFLRGLIRGLITSGTHYPYPFFGEMIAFLSSASLITFFIIFNKILNFKKKNEKNNYLKLSFTLLLTLISQVIFLTTINVIFIIPIYQSGGKSFILSSYLKNNKNMNLNSYLKTYISIFFSFNLIKYFFNLLIFGLMENRLVLISKNYIR